MENLIVIVLKTEALSPVAYREMLQLDREDHVDLLEAVVVARDCNGRLSIRESSGSTLAQTFAGNLAGKFAEPLGDQPSFTSNPPFRAAWNAYRMDVSEAYLTDLTQCLKRGSVALIAHVLEERTLLLDRRMAKYAASLLRIPM